MTLDYFARLRPLNLPFLNPDNPLGAIRYDSPSTVRPELVEGLVPQRGMVRQAHHERSNGLSGFIAGSLAILFWLGRR